MGGLADRRPLPSLTALRAFEAFARLGQMTLAADELCVTHGAISRQIRSLETTLGLALTEGPRHRLRLTDGGARLAAALSGAFGQVDAALADLRGDLHAELRLSCVGTLAIRWLIPRLPAFHARHPEVRVRVTESYAPVDFARDRFDAAIRVNETAPIVGAEAVAFLDNFHGPVVAPALLGDGPTGLEGLTRLTTGSRQTAWAEWEQHSGIRLPEPPDVQEFEHIFYTLEAAAAGLGVGLTPWVYVAADVAAGRLAAPLGFAPTPSRFWFLTPAGPQKPAVARFRDWLIEEAGNVAPPPSAVRTAA
ncbi:LysR substrate-binding domain-containing protein [Phenylobacterium kunshanense]|uniref:LysR family transcriptional regulator n=1 Tax=Phenylobacterium kunshanense TaxID=1445034 RepID=A0A328BT05_9CAUL|nr:LysR substrate-binding domain-containing protein [Phenylobacterium kunshanense]RAK68984.1 LysR family transcriptional regulator [Phenylobacterium kunshanense]